MFILHLSPVKVHSPYRAATIKIFCLDTQLQNPINISNYIRFRNQGNLVSVAEPNKSSTVDVIYGVF